MKSITIHNLGTDLAQVIERMAAESGLSQNKLIKRLLRSSLGLDQPTEPPNDFERFSGIWTEEDVANFNLATSTFGEIDEDLWH